MKEFMYAFQIDKMTVFEVSYYTLGSNKAPHFATEAARFIRSKRDYAECGQAQKRVLVPGSLARHFYDKWDYLHLHVLTSEKYAEICADIENLKAKYNYIEDVRDSFKGVSYGCMAPHIPFYKIVELSKLMPKWKERATA